MATSSSYVRPTGPAPADAPKTSFAQAIPYGTKTPQQSLTVTVLQWPSGMIFPPAPLSATIPTEAAKTFGPDEYGEWNGEQIHVDKDQFNVMIGSVPHNLVNEGSAVSITPITSTTPTDSATGSSQVMNPSITTSGSANQGPTQTTSPTPVSSKAATVGHGISSGAAAGIAIGCLLAGALIAGALAWLCLGRRRKSAPARDSEASTLALMHKEKGTGAKAISVDSGSPIAAAMENGLPQPLEDKAISGEISKISNLIKNHVQSYYHTRGVSPGMIDYDDIQALGSELPVSTGTLSTLLGNSATREIALRFCIAWVAVSRMQLSGQPGRTFLPPEISKCFQEMSLVDRGSRVHATFFAKWRVITAELMQSSYVRNPFSPSDARLHSIQDAVSVLDNLLRPYSDSRVDNGQRSRNLEEILKRAAIFAYTLFSQPSSWDFDWQREQGVKSGSICIFPSLVQVADENGEPIKPARPFSEAVVRRLDE